MLFAHLKTHPAARPIAAYEDRNGARDEFLLAATAQNLRKLAKLIPLGGQAVPA